MIPHTHDLSVHPPNSVEVVGEYNFYVNDWLFSMVVEAPCASMDLKGLEADVPLSITLDEEKTLLLELAPDANNQPWERLCGRLTHAAVYNAGDFVSLDLDEEKLVVRPLKKLHLGLHIVGIEQVRYYSWSFRTIIILVNEPENYID